MRSHWPIGALGCLQACLWLVLSACDPAGEGSAATGPGDKVTPPENFAVGCNLARPDLKKLVEVSATPKGPCTPQPGDSAVIEHVYVTGLPLDQGAKIFVSGRFTLQSVASAGIELWVYWARLSDCVGGEATAPSGGFELWGTLGELTSDPPTPTTTIAVDLSYETTSTDCEYELAAGL